MNRRVVVGLLVVLAPGCGPPRMAGEPAMPVAPDVNGLWSDPPVAAKCELMPLPDYVKARRYLAHDLNDDGTPEYFIENTAGAHSMGFALVDASGTLLTAPDAVGEIGGDRMVILNVRHHGYHDIICSARDAWSVSGARWEHDGRRYVKVESFSFEGGERDKAFVETEPGKARTCWYFDVFAGPLQQWPGHEGVLPHGSGRDDGEMKPQRHNGHDDRLRGSASTSWSSCRRG